MCAKPKALLATRDSGSRADCEPSTRAPPTFGGGIGGALWPLWVQEIEKRKGRQANASRRRGVHHHTRKTTKIANNSNHARPVSWIISTPSAMSHFFHFGLDIATGRKGPDLSGAQGVILPTPSQPDAPERVPRRVSPRDRLRPGLARPAPRGRPISSTIYRLVRPLLSQTTRRPLLSIQRPPRLTCRHPGGSGRHPIGPHSISAPRARKRSALSWLGEMPICAYAEHAIEIRAHKLVNETAKRIIWPPSRRYGAYRCASLRPWLSPRGKPRRRLRDECSTGLQPFPMVGRGRTA
jgi:hypothetical protein